MIDINLFANDLNNILNVSLTEDSPLNKVEKNVLFEFNIVQDTDYYKPAERYGNNVVRYINGVMSIVSTDTVSIPIDDDAPSSDINTSLSTFSANIVTNVQLIIPMFPKKRSSNDLLSAVRNHIEKVLQLNSKRTVTADNMVYLQLIQYSIPLTGLRAQVHNVGDSIVLQMEIAYTLITQGIAPDSYKVYLVEGATETRILYQRLGIGRKTISESATPSSSALPSSRSVPSSTVLSISMDLISRLTAFDDVITNYNITGELSQLKIKLVVPLSSGNNISKIYDMIIDSSGMNGQIESIPSATVTLVEAF